MPGAKNIVVNILGRTRGLRTALARAGRLVKRFTATVAAAAKAMRGLFAISGLAGLGGIVAAVIGIGRLIDRIDQLNKSAQRLGTTTDNVQMARRFAALADVDLERVIRATGRLSRNLQDLREGQAEKEVANAFERLGLALKDIPADPLQALLKIGTAIAKIDDPIKRLATGQELIGRGFQELLPLFLMGEAALGKLQRNFERLDANLSGTLINNVTLLNDKLAILGQVTEDTSNSIFGHLSPVFNRLTDDLQRFIGQLLGAERGIQNVGKAIAQELADAIQFVLERLQTLLNAFIAVNNFIAKLVPGGGGGKLRGIGGLSIPVPKERERFTFGDFQKGELRGMATEETARKQLQENAEMKALMQGFIEGLGSRQQSGPAMIVSR